MMTFRIHIMYSIIIIYYQQTMVSMISNTIPLKLPTSTSRKQHQHQSTISDIDVGMLSLLAKHLAGEGELTLDQVENINETSIDNVDDNTIKDIYHAVAPARSREVR